MMTILATMFAMMVTTGICCFLYLVYGGADYSRLVDEQAKRPFQNGKWKDD